MFAGDSLTSYLLFWPDSEFCKNNLEYEFKYIFSNEEYTKKYASRKVEYLTLLSDLTIKWPIGK